MAANLELTAKEDISAKLFKLEQQNQRLIDQNKQFAGQLKQSHGDAMAWAQGQVMSITSMVAGYLSIEKAIGAVTVALERKQEVERRANELTITAADAERTMLRNLGNVTKTEQSDFIKSIEKLNAQYSPAGGLESLHKEAASALSASGGNRQQSLAIMEAGIRFAPDSGEIREEMSSALANLSKASRDKDPMKNLGLLYSLGTESPVRDWAKISRNLTPALIGVTQRGGTVQEAAALVAAIGQGSGDVMGEQTRSATISFAGQLEDFLPKDGRYEFTTDSQGRKRRKIAAKATGLTSTKERIEYLRENPRQREEFLAGLSIERTQEAAVKQLVTGKNTMTGEFYEQTLKNLNKPLAVMSKDAEEKIGLMNQPFGQGVASMSRKMDNAERMLVDTLRGKEDALQGVFSNTKLNEHLKASGEGWTQWSGRNTIGRFVDEAIAGQSSEEFYNRHINQRIAQLRLNPTVENEETANVLESLAKEQLEESKRLREDINRIRSELEKQGRTPSASAVQNNRNQHGEQ